MATLRVAPQPAARILDRVEDLQDAVLHRITINELIQRNLAGRLQLQIEKYGDHVPPGGISLCSTCNEDLRIGSQMCAACRAADLDELLERIGKSGGRRR